VGMCGMDLRTLLYVVSYILQEVLLSNCLNVSG
jgi:hypothetical protein